MKIGLILPGNIWFCPYVNIYTQIMDKEGIKYDLISWNRDGTDKVNGYQFGQKLNNLSNPIYKLLSIFRYVAFIKNIVRKNKYNKLIVFGPQIAIFISAFLNKYYKNRYVFDYRDLSIEQKCIFKRTFKKVLNNSYLNVISSPGFKKYLPHGYEYILSHNFNINVVKEVLANEDKTSICLDRINVLTIGGIRDYSSNIEVVKSLANKNPFYLEFIGKGVAADMIKSYAMEHRITNIEFKGYYPKEKEAEYIRQATFLNIYYPKKPSHDTALSNRFYNALIYRKPMIVTSDTVQGDYVESYQLGLSIENCDSLDNKINEYVENFDAKLFSAKCNELLLNFLDDYKTFENNIINFIR